MNSHFKSKILSILFLSIATLFISCEDQGGFRDNLGNYYFDSITELELVGENDCSLAECSTEKAKLIYFYQVAGLLTENIISAPNTLHNPYILEVCNMDKFDMPDVSSVIFTGIARAGCGQVEAANGQDAGTGYFFELVSIELYK